MRQTWEDEMSQVQDMTYFDLHHPWFASAGKEPAMSGREEAREGRPEDPREG
jgi:hypothetical protein